MMPKLSFVEPKNACNDIVIGQPQLAICPTGDEKLSTLLFGGVVAHHCFGNDRLY
jgi:hypothetical protein